MIVKSENAQKRNFFGVEFVLLSHGPETMVAKMLYKAEDKVPKHSHPNEQSGYVISGKYRIIFGDTDQIIGPGDAYTISKNIEHSIEIIVPGEVIDVFSPPREDYL